jgi:hypothetical protein
LTLFKIDVNALEKETRYYNGVEESIWLISEFLVEVGNGVAHFSAPVFPLVRHDEIFQPYYRKAV